MRDRNPYTHPRWRKFDHIGLVTARRLIEELLARELPADESALIIDVGCGRAPWKQLFAPYAREYIGVDLKTGPAVQVTAPAEKLPFPDAHADVIFSNSVLEHVRGWREAITEMHRILKPGGLALVGVPFIFPIHGSPHDYWRWTPHGFDVIFSAFSKVRVEQAGGWLTNYLQVQNIFYRDLQERHHGLRALWSPFIMLNNLTGRLFGMRKRSFTGMATFYIVVARK
ncbi:MAG TPA: methyltransferase domain-containing protein [Kiritimatiellia bacterium]|mgnify:CR=1 FL=1|nr:methyltransferase domain-containing protein [Kiritimatiellia bacterium]